MAQLAISFAGAAIGFAVGGPVGAQIGWAAGSLLGSQLGPGTQGPKLSDTKVQISSYGAMLPIVYGGDQLAGNVIWSTDLVESESTSSAKGGPSATTFTYSVSCAIAICEGEIQSIRKIWADAALVYNVAEDATEDELKASYKFEQFFVLYPGSEAQTVDPTIQAHEGVGNVEAYLGTAYIVFTDMPLEKYGNRIPNFRFEIAGEGAEACVLPERPAITDITQLGVPQALTLDFQFSPNDESGVTYQLKRINPNGSIQDAAISDNVNGIWRDNQAGPYWNLGESYSFFVVATNECGSVSGPQSQVTWFGQIGGEGRFVGTLLGPCASHWGGYGYSGPEFGNICYKATPSGNYDNAQVATGIYPEITIGPDAEEGDPLAGVVEEISTTLDLIVADICERADPNLTVDVSDLEGQIVLGYKIAKQESARASLEPLRKAYFFDAVENGDTVQFIRRGGASIVSITRDDLGASEGNPIALIEPTRSQETELPSQIVVSYSVRTADYQTGTQRSRRSTTGSLQVAGVELPIVMTDQKAAEVAAVMMYDAWAGRTSRTFSTLRQFTKYLPTDVVTVNDGEFTTTGRIAEKVEDGPVIKWVVVDHDPAAYAPVVTPVVTPGGGVAVVFPSPLSVDIIDTPALRDADAIDAGFYVAVHATSFAPGMLYESADDADFTPLQALNVPAVAGTAPITLGDWTGGNTVDEQSVVEVVLDAGTLASITRAQHLNGGNAALLGDEVVCFRSATLIGTLRWRLTGFLRARRGTDYATSTHVGGERFVLLDPANVYRVAQDIDDLGTKFFRPVRAGTSVDGVASEEVQITGAALKPLSVAHLRAIPDTSTPGDWLIRWVRRGRIGQSLRDGLDVPINEDSESYVVEQVRANAVIDTQTVTTQEAAVTGLADDVVNVYQMSAAVGRGFVASVTLV